MVKFVLLRAWGWAIRTIGRTMRSEAVSKRYNVGMFRNERFFETGASTLPSRAAAIYPAIQVPEVVTPYVVEHPVEAQRQLMVFPEQEAIFATPKPKSTVGTLLESVKFDFVKGAEGLMKKLGETKVGRALALGTAVTAGLVTVVPAMAESKGPARDAKIEHVGSNLGAEASGRAVNPFNSLPNLILSRYFGESSSIKKKAESDLSGPQVQFFNVVASDNPQSTVNPNTRTFIAGLQNYAKQRGEGLRVRIAQKNGQYDVPFIRINMTQAEIVSSAYKDGKAVIDNLSSTIKDLGYPIKDRVNLALLEGNTGGSCFLLPYGAPNPGNVETLSISTKDATCHNSNSEVGFSGLNVLGAQGIIWIPRIGNFVRDAKDTMSDLSLGKNSINWAWWETRFNNSNTYGSQLHNSGYFQHHLSIQTSGSGIGELTRSPAPDKCEIDCGNGLLYPAGTKVTLKADPKPGNRFTGWENCPSPAGDTCQVPMDAERNVTANFTREQTTTTTTTTTTTAPKIKYNLIFYITKDKGGPGKHGRISLGRRYGNEYRYAPPTRKPIKYEARYKGEKVRVKLIPDNGYRVWAESGEEGNAKERDLKDITVKIINNKNPGDNRKFDYGTVTFIKSKPTTK